MGDGAGVGGDVVEERLGAEEAGDAGGLGGIGVGVVKLHALKSSRNCPRARSLPSTMRP